MFIPMSKTVFKHMLMLVLLLSSTTRPRNGLLIWAQLYVVGDQKGQNGGKVDQSGPSGIVVAGAILCIFYV
jgi:hypothetical protein